MLTNSASGTALIKPSRSHKSFFFILWFAITSLFVLVPPINDPIRFAFFGITILVLCCSDRRASWRHIIYLTVFAIIICIVRLSLPIGQVAEQHQLFLTKGHPKTESSHALLPPPILNAFTAEFLRAYPISKQCDEKIYGCWRSFQLPAEPFAWSADNTWVQAPGISRMTRDINVHDLISARIGVINELHYNWYNTLHDKKLSDIQRETAPFWVSYVLPSAADGGQLCWQGTLWSENNNGAATKENHANYECKTITTTDTGARVWMGFITPGMTQRVELQWPAMQIAWQVLDMVLAGVGILALMFGALQPRWRMLAIASGITTAAAGLFIVWHGQMLVGLLPQGGGADGLVHSGDARMMAEAIYRGDWLQALRGEEDIFYFMPGLRYFLALQQWIFGEMYYGTILVCLLFPFLLWRLFRQLDLEIWTVPVLVISFCLSRAAEIFGFSYQFYAEQTAEAMAEPMGYLFWLMGLLLITKIYQNPQTQPRWYWPAAGALWALATFMRPNLLIADAFGVLVCAVYLIRKHEYKNIISLCAGMSFILICLVHNLYFGHQWVPLSSAASHPADLWMPPARYLEAIGNLLSGNISSPAVAAMKDQIIKWMGGLRITAIIRVIEMVFAVWILVTQWQKWRHNFLSWLLILTCAGLHAPLFFFIPDGRYAQLAWLMTFILTLHLLKHIHFGAQSQKLTKFLPVIKN